MENQNRSDLDNRIAAWRRQLLAKEVIQSDEADELESHLRISMGVLMEQGLSPDEAFLVAQKRLGLVEQLHGEYEKINGHRFWGCKIAWMIGGYLGITLIMGLIKVIASASVFVGKIYPLDGNQMGWVYSIATLAMLTAFIALTTWVSTGTIPLPQLQDRLCSYSVRKKSVLLLILLSVVAGLDIGRSVLPVKLYSVHEVGQYYLVTNYLSLFLRIALPLVWVVVALKIIKKNRATQMQVE